METFGLTTLKAMATELPVIVPTKGGIAEMVEEGTNGYKIDVQHIKVIASNISRMLEDRNYIIFCLTMP